MSPPNPSAKEDGDGTTNRSHENNLAKFRNGDVIGHPAGIVFAKFAGEFGAVCYGAGIPCCPKTRTTPLSCR